MLDLKWPRVELDKRLAMLISTAGLLYVTFFWRLSTLTKGLSPSEALSRTNADSLKAILDSPINAPHTLVQYLFHRVGLNSVFYLRFASVIFGLVFLASFYKIAKHWFGKYIAGITTLILGVTPFYILASRSADASIMYLSPLLVGACYFWFSRLENPSWKVYFLLILAGCVAAYTPGLFWLLILGLYAIKNHIKKIVGMYDIKINLGALLLVLLALAPLAVGLSEKPTLIKDWLLIPNTVNFQLVKDIIWSALAVFWHSSHHSNLQIDNLPIISTTQLFLAVFGVYALWSRAQDKLVYLAATILLIIIGSGAHNNYGFLAITLIPICLLAAAGLRYLHMEWQGVFPRNPLPRGLALILISLLALGSINYGIRYSLMAWPNTTSTKSTYVIK